MALADFWKVLLGRVPLPADVVESFPAWAHVPGRLAARHHGEMGDLVTQDYPFRHFTAAAVRHGQLPLWQPHLLAGYPWVGALQWGVFSPLSVAYYALPTTTAWALSFVLRLWLASVFMTLLCRRLGAATAPAVVAGLAYGGAGFVLAWSGWPPADVAVWIPAVMLGIDCLRERPTVNRSVLTALALAALLLAGHPQTILYATLLIGAFAVHRAIGSSVDGDRATARRGPFVAAVAGVVVLGLGLSAVQLVPGAEWLGTLNRDTNHVYADHRPLGAIAGLVSRDVAHTPNGAGIDLPGGALYLGMLVVIGSALALLWRRRRDTIFFAAVTAVGALVTFGVQPFFWIAKHTPLIKAVPNGRMTLFLCVGLPVLASLGITAALDGARTRTGTAPARALWAAWAAGVVGAAALLALLVHRTHGPVGDLASALHGPGASIVFGLLAAALLAPTVLRRLPQRVATSAIVLLAVADLATFGSATFPLVTRSQVYRRAPILDSLRALNTDAGRVAVVDTALPANVGLIYGFDTADGYDQVTRRMARFVDGMGTPGQNFAFTSSGIATHLDRRLDLLAVRYLVTSDYNAGRDAIAAQPARFRQVAAADHTQIFENLRALPRAWLVPATGARSVDGADAADAAVRSASFDPTREVLIDGAVPGLEGGAPAPAPSPGIRLVNGNSTVRMSVSAASPSIVVVSQQWFAGWRARVDGHVRPVLHVDGVLQGVAVGPGAHSIVLRYEPSSFQWGLIISAVTLTFTLTLLWLGRPRRSASPVFPKIEGA
jgi:hypothetical protein